MADYLVTVDETSDVQNTDDSGATSNDTGSTLPDRLAQALTAAGGVSGVANSTALSGVDGTQANSGGTNVLTFGADVLDVSFTDSNGDPLDGLDSGLTTTSGHRILLYTGEFDNNVVLGIDEQTGDIVFAIYMESNATSFGDGDADVNATGAKLWLVQFESIEHGDATDDNDLEVLSNKIFVSVDNLLEFSLAGAPSGQNLFLMFGNKTQNGDPPTVAIVVTGKNPEGGDTVNTGQGGGATTIGSNNQMIDPGEGMWFTFVDNPNLAYTVPNLDQNEADLEANIAFGSYHGADSASFALVQLQPPKGASLKISAFFNTDGAEVGANYLEGLGDGDDTPVNILSVTVVRTAKNGTQTTYAFSESDPSSKGGISADFSGDTVLLRGLVAGDDLTYVTDGDHNRVLVDNVGNPQNARQNSAFDIGAFRLTSGGLETTALGDIAFVDDAPTASIDRTLNTITLDESQGTPGGDLTADDDDSPSVVADPFSGEFGTPFGAVVDVDLVDTTTTVGADADGAPGAAVTLEIVDGDGSWSGLVTSDGTTHINLWQESPTTVSGRAGGSDDAVVFVIRINGSGQVSVAQYAAIGHPLGGASNPDDRVDLTDRLHAVVTQLDGDDDTASDSIDIGAAIRFEDDAPTVSANLTARLDDDALGGNSGGTGDDTDAQNLSGTLGLTFGRDGAGSVAWRTSGAPTGFSYELSGDDLLVKQGTTTVLTLTLDTATGAYTVTQNAPIAHAAGSAENNASFTVGYRVTDDDGDWVDGTLAIDVDDDTPVVSARSDLVYANSSNPSPGGTGVFAYAIGADARTSWSASNSDFYSVALTGGNVGSGAGSAITPTGATGTTWQSESAASAVYAVSFSYVSNPFDGSTSQATGTLTFNKTAGTYTLQLAAPISSYSLLTTSTAQGFAGYELDTSTPDNTQPAVSVARLSSSFHVQFQGYAEPGSGTGANNLVAGGDGTFTNDQQELFTQAASWVSVSGSAAGVAGDTIQKGEVLDLDFYLTDPKGNTGQAPTATTSGVYIKFDGITHSMTNGEDFVVVLKLIDANGDPGTRITRAVVVDNYDIYVKTDPAIPVPAAYSNVSLDNNDGLVIIESNDYNRDLGGGNVEHYVIEGLQVLVSTEGLSGSGISLNPAVGAGGFSSGTTAFGAATTDNDVMKIVDMGFFTTITPTSQLQFNVAVQDTDGDVSATQVLDVTVVSGATFTAGTDREALQGRAGLADTFVFASVAASPAGASHDVVSGFTSGQDRIDVSGIDANSTGGGANDAFTWIGAAAFSNVAGQLRFDGTSHLLEGDVNGDGTADFAVELAGVATLQASDVVV